MNRLKALALALGTALGMAALPSAHAHDMRHPGWSNGGQRPGAHARHHHHRHFDRHFHHRHFHRHVHPRHAHVPHRH